MKKFENIINTMKEIALTTTFIISIIAGITFLIAVCFADSDTEIPMVICGICIAWFIIALLLFKYVFKID